MALKVFVPLHEDATEFDCPRKDALAIEREFERAAAAISARLGPAVGECWPELEFLFLEAWLGATADPVPRDVRFSRRNRELSLTVRLAGRDLLADGAKAFARRSLSILLSALVTVTEKRGQSAVAAVARELAAELERAGSLAAAPGARKTAAKADSAAIPPKPRRRIGFGRTPGELWVMVETAREFGDRRDESLRRKLEVRLAESGLGGVTGSSMGSHQLDISIRTRNLRDCRDALTAWLGEFAPGRSWRIAREWEPPGVAKPASDA